MLSARAHYHAFGELLALLTRHRQLTWEMTRREISDRYAGQVLGVFWAVGHPLVLMGIYVFVFTCVFRMKIGGTVELPLDYTTYLLAGLIPWFAFQESMSKSASVIVQHSNLVKQVVFPIEVLPVKGVIASFFTQAVATVILAVYVVAKHGSLPWTYALLPVLFLLQSLAMVGVAYVFASVGTYFRDLKDFVQVFCVAGMYIMPIFYLPAMVPDVFRPVLYLNPFSYLAWCYQDVCYFGRFEHPWAWLVFLTMSVGVFYGGYRIFRKLKVYFGSVL
ncbi:MAG: ABC transporter [Planctomycetes bacterium RBG_13_63_9]|nr:MAG: ABC transporter [Planctomycetes bacterium RBG_13_63_9]